MAEEVKDLLIPHLAFTKDWRNRDDFPTYEPNEDQVREDMQFLYEEIKAYLNENVAGTLCKTLQKHMSMIVVNKVRFLETAIDGDDITLKLEITSSDGQVITTDCPLKDLSEVVRVNIVSIEYDPATREWIFTYADGVKNRVTVPSSENARVSMDTPGAAHNPDDGFTVGMQWLRPGFTVDNHALKDWEMVKGVVAKGEHIWTFTADGGTGTIEAEQVLSNIGEAGQKIYVMLLAEDIVDHQTTLTVNLNGESHDLMTGGGVFETALDEEGSLKITVNGAWSYAASAATVVLAHLVVVNSDAIEAEAGGSLPLSDWPSFIETYAPFEQVIMPRTLFIQEAPGRWVPTDYEVRPISRGGTGLNEVSKGQMLYADGDNSLRALDPPEEADSFLTYNGEKPAWQTRAQVIETLGQLKLMTGTYTGTSTDRTIELPVTPKILFITSADIKLERAGSSSTDDQELVNTPKILTNGSKDAERWVYSYQYNDNNYELLGTSYVSLDGDVLSFSSDKGFNNSKIPAKCANESGTVYTWTAIY